MYGSIHQSITLLKLKRQVWWSTWTITWIANQLLNQLFYRKTIQMKDVLQSKKQTDLNIWNSNRPTFEHLNINFPLNYQNGLVRRRWLSNTSKSAISKSPRFHCFSMFNIKYLKARKRDTYVDSVSIHETLIMEFEKKRNQKHKYCPIFLW